MDSRLRGNDDDGKARPVDKATYPVREWDQWGASVARCSPYRWNPILLPGSVQPRYFGVTSGREALSYAAIASASLSLALVCMGRCGGPIPNENSAFQHTSILVRPHQLSRWVGTLHACRPSGAGGGAAGYCPRVRCVYCTPPFIVIAGWKPARGDIGACPGFEKKRTSLARDAVAWATGSC